MSRFQHSKVGATALLPLLISACGGDAPSNAAFTVRDSAGIRVSESPVPAWEPGDEWTLSPEPELQIGALDGPSQYTFDRIGDAYLLSDGRIAVTNWRTSEIRFFGSDGSFLSSVGRAGEGPGEFRSIEAWRGRADTIFVFDARLSRVSKLDPSGAFLSSAGLKGEPALGYPSAMGSTRNGNLLVTSGTGGYEAGDSGLTEGNEIIFSRHGPEGDFLNIIARFPADPHWVYTASGRTASQYPPHSVGWIAHAWAPDRLFLAPGWKPELQVWTPDGAMVEVFRWGAEERLVGDAEMAQYREEFLNAYEDPNEKRFWEGWLRDVPFPESLPTFDGLLLDRTGHLWVEQYKPFWDDSFTWSILTPDGAWLGDMSTPPGFRLKEIGSDYLLGVWRDELGVEYVRMYGLDRKG